MRDDHFSLFRQSDAMTATQRITFTKLTQKQAAAAAARHEMLYAGRMGGARAVFAFCDLSGLDLAGRNLADADFTGAILEECNFASARLEFREFLRRRFAPGQSCGGEPAAGRHARRLAAGRQSDRRRHV